ncbi:MAG: hypothetical protein Q8O13_07420 [Candidatus Omnitrophota bacterium]|nr:hypothetical protein [Candidatus Omnitrophota bacterium]
MEDKLKDIFHSLFNKINNINVAAGLNKKILQEENLDSLLKEGLIERISQIVQVFERIEDNARSLDENLKLLFKSFKEDNGCA